MKRTLALTVVTALCAVSPFVAGAAMSSLQQPGADAPATSYDGAQAEYILRDYEGYVSVFASDADRRPLQVTGIEVAGLRRADTAHADRAAFLIPLVLEHYDSAPDDLEDRLRNMAAELGLLRGTDDRSALVVLAAVLDGPTDYEAGFTQLVEQSANKYLRHFVFYCCGRVVAVLLGNPSDFEEYLHILADEICQLADRALGRTANVGISREATQFASLNDAYKQAIEALRAAAEGEGGVSFTADARKTGSLCERALEIIGQHYMDEDLSLASLSAMLDVSPNHLSACIKKSEGETFINILVRRRMETAQQLLLTTDLQIQEIARRCGYTDQHYFSYCFKKYSGTSPVALRRARAAGEVHA